MTRPLEDWTDRKFRSGGRVAHFVPWSEQRALCGVIDGVLGEELFGTGDFDEIEYAMTLPACEACLQTAQPNTTPHDGSWEDLLPELIP